MTNRKSATELQRPFGDLLKKLVRVPKEELLSEERKYNEAKRRRQAKASKKKS